MHRLLDIYFALLPPKHSTQLVSQTAEVKHLCHRLIMANTLLPPLSLLKNTLCAAAATVNTEHEALIVRFEKEKKDKLLTLWGSA